MPACVIARIILKVKILKETSELTPLNDDSIKTKTSEILKNPERLRKLIENNQNTNEDDEAAATIKDNQYDLLWTNAISRAVQHDDLYSPAADACRHAAGKIHEERLIEFLDKIAQISYMEEKQLRSKGYAKTPDIKLYYPISIDGGKTVVNWIESKASFGDAKSHEKYMKEQLWPYHNRFGPGAVIYWFGFEESIASENGTCPILIIEELPDLQSIIKIQSKYL